jgi:mannose-6-phosphate isomerase-like protein (cupin superfamily)
MDPFKADMQKKARDNEFFREVVFTGAHSQLVLMALAVGEDIGDEVHSVDQLFVFVEGAGEAVLDGRLWDVRVGEVLCVPAGTRHNIRNVGAVPLKLYTVYAPPEHAPGTTHRTKAEALIAEEKEHATV